MGVPFSNRHAGQGGWCIHRAELWWSRGGKQERNLTVLPPFPLTPVSPEADCSASHEQSFFQHQNVPQAWLWLISPLQLHKGCSKSLQRAGCGARG